MTGSSVMGTASCSCRLSLKPTARMESIFVLLMECNVRAIMMVDEQSRSLVGMGVEVEDDDGLSVAFCHWY